MYNFNADNLMRDENLVKELTTLKGDWKHLFGVVCTNRPFFYLLIF